MPGVGVERVGVITESGDGDAVDAHQVADMGRLLGREVGHVDVGHARIPAIGAAGRPAHQLDAAELLVGREGEDLFESQFRQDGTDEAELHGRTFPPKDAVRNPRHSG